MGTLKKYSLILQMFVSIWDSFPHFFVKFVIIDSFYHLILTIKIIEISVCFYPWRQKMETLDKSSNLLARLRNVTLEDDLQFSDLWPKENSTPETRSESSFNSDNFSSFSSSWDDFRSSSSSGTFFDSENKSESTLNYNSASELGPEDFTVSSFSASGPVENRENPFAKISRKGSGAASGLSQKPGGWIMSTSCFGVLGIVCGGLLAAWSILSGSGTHSMTALGLSLTISGILMFISVGVSRMVFDFSGQT